MAPGINPHKGSDDRFLMVESEDSTAMAILVGLGYGQERDGQWFVDECCEPSCSNWAVVRGMCAWCAAKLIDRLATESEILAVIGNPGPYLDFGQDASNTTRIGIIEDVVRLFDEKKKMAIQSLAAKKG